MNSDQSPLEPAEAVEEAADAAEEDSVQNLSFNQIWEEFRRRKVAYRKRNRRNPTGVIVGKVEGGVFAANRHELARRKMIRMEGRHLFICNMMVIVGAQTSCIAPFHIDLKQLDEENPYDDIS